MNFAEKKTNKGSLVYGELGKYFASVEAIQMSKPDLVLLLSLFNNQTCYKAIFCFRVSAYVEIYALHYHVPSHLWRHTPILQPTLTHLSVSSLNTTNEKSVPDHLSHFQSIPIKLVSDYFHLELQLTLEQHRCWGCSPPPHNKKSTYNS